jgi:hypothetical protein
LAFSTIASAGGWTDLLSGSHYPLQVDYLDGYFIVINGSMSFWVSNLYDGTTYNALATSPVSASPDTIVGLAAHSQRIFFFKQNTTEIWYDVGTPTASGSPFLRQSGAVYDFGCASRWTIAKGAGLLFFLATQKMNNGGEVVGVAMVQESAPQIISTPAISWRIAQSTTHADSFAYCYTEEGHIFYVLTNPTDNWTLVYDATTNLWHERSSFASDSVTVNRHVGNCYAYFNNKHYIGDYRSSTILEMSSKYFNDNGNDIWSFRTAQTIFDPNELDHVFIHMLALDVETGVSGTEETLTVQAITPYQAGDNHYGPVQSGPDMADDDLPEVYRADIAAVATGFTTVAGSFAGILAGSKIKVTGFTNAAINTVYTAESLTDTAIHTVVHPTATESAGNAVTIYNYNDVLIKADGTIFGGASISGVMGAVAYLSWSNDGGHTWSNSYAADLGTAPVYNTRVRWRRLGYSNNRVFKIAIKAAVKKIVLGAYVEASK